MRVALFKGSLIQRPEACFAFHTSSRPIKVICDAEAAKALGQSARLKLTKLSCGSQDRILARHDARGVLAGLAALKDARSLDIGLKYAAPEMRPACDRPRS